MKELSIEEKAKAYDEAREKIAIRFGSNVSDEIFSQFEMSEDERIRKYLISFVELNSGVNLPPDDAKEMLAWLEKQGEQKSDDKVVQKFNVGEWIYHEISGNAFHINRIENCTYISDEGAIISFGRQNHWRLWTIQDAKDGDVLVSESNCGLNTWYCIFKSLDDDESMTVHCYLARDGRFETKKELCFDKDPYNTKPATKEQRDQLEKAMADAGYTFDFDKKELKKIENEIEIPFGAKDSELQEATYYIPKGFYAEIEGDKIVIKKGEQKSSWSEEDNKMSRFIGNAITADDASIYLKSKGIQIIDAYIWLEELKERVLSQTKQEWSEEDDYTLGETIQHLEELIRIDKAKHCGVDVQYYQRDIDWLKSLKEKYTWKPSEEQMHALHDLNLTGGISYVGQGQELINLYNDLKKLKG